MFHGNVLHLLPVISRLVAALVKEVEFRTIWYTCFIVNIIRVCSPGKINDILGQKMPGQLTGWTFDAGASFFVAVSNLFRVLKDSRTTNNIRRI